MFSKFLHGQDQNALEALELQWRMEFAKAQRKFKCNKKEEGPTSKKKRGRPALGQLNLNTLVNVKDSAGLSKLARSIATTREGRRLHAKVAKDYAEKKQSNSSCNKKVCIFFTCLFIFVVMHLLLLLLLLFVRFYFV